ncbi:probable leucine-rich repeat receptor-like protein kinase [Tanacetum coccineum]
MQALLKLLADDIVYSVLKVSAALGYMAPEYITTGKFMKKTDVYAFGVVVLRIRSGKSNLTGSIHALSIEDSANTLPSEDVAASIRKGSVVQEIVIILDRLKTALKMLAEGEFSSENVTKVIDMAIWEE